MLIVIVVCTLFIRYWLPAEFTNDISIHVLRSGVLSEALWGRSGAPSTDWEVAEVTVSSPAKFRVSSFLSFFVAFNIVTFSISWMMWPKTVLVCPQVVFNAHYVPGMNNTVKLDDISMREGACSPSGSCDFESGQCSWVNIPKQHGHDWVLANGGIEGPATDHTTQTSEGTTSPNLFDALKSLNQKLLL